MDRKCQLWTRVPGLYMVHVSFGDIRVYLFYLICVVARAINSPVAGRALCVLRRGSVAHSRKQRSKKCLIFPEQHLKTINLIRSSTGRWSNHQRFFCHRFPSHSGPVCVVILLCRLFSRVLLLRGSSELFSNKHLRHAFSSLFVRWDYFSPSPTDCLTFQVHITPPPQTAEPGNTISHLLLDIVLWWCV